MLSDRGPFSSHKFLVCGRLMIVLGGLLSFSVLKSSIWEISKENLEVNPRSFFS